MYIGRVLPDMEMEIARPVCVLGWLVVQDLFAGRNPVGEDHLHGPRPFQIIRVGWRERPEPGEGVDHAILVPLTVAQRGRGTNWVDEVFLKAKQTRIRISIVKGCGWAYLRV